MKKYKVVITDDANETRKELSTIAESLYYCKNPRLAKLGYRKINFRRHDFIMLYRVEGDTAYVEWIYHELQDYENKFS